MTGDVHEIVEEQLNRWQLALPDAARLTQKGTRPNVITVASSIGACGDRISPRVGEMLNIPVHDRDIVAHIASHARVSARTVELLDERARVELDDHVAALLRERNFDQDDYLRALMVTVSALWAHGPCVLVGRGAVHIIPRSHALAVRLTAALPVRVERLAEREGTSVAEARQRVEQADAERALFHQRSFGADVDAGEHYDLVIDTSRIGVEGAAMALVDLFRRKFNGRWYTPMPAPAKYEKC